MSQGGWYRRGTNVANPSKGAPHLKSERRFRESQEPDTTATSDEGAVDDDTPFVLVFPRTPPTALPPRKRRPLYEYAVAPLPSKRMCVDGGDIESPVLTSPSAKESLSSTEDRGSSGSDDHDDDETTVLPSDDDDGNARSHHTAASIARDLDAEARRLARLCKVTEALWHQTTLALEGVCDAAARLRRISGAHDNDSAGDGAAASP